MRAKQIREFVKIVEESNVGELEITRWWWGKIRISKSSSHVTTKISPADVQENVSISHSTKTVSGEPTVTEPLTVEKVSESNLVEIKAPMVGTFYRAPAPDADPYVKEGDNISTGKVLCIIEAMKLMNEIESEINGKIVKVLADNAQPVEYNQPLFLVEPS
ncbi:acetyl-CoA carboxylase biotin carboxyl carrier protein [candidate division KSB1 bacterium]|nr:acetyl-CoA carboxylase biotin carboxyl carrier protein [candidate division KSB1 bacterium]